MEIKKINEFYSERVSEVQLKLDNIRENLDDSEIADGLLEFLKMMDEEIEGIYEDSIDYLTEKIENPNSGKVEEIDELSSDDEDPTLVKKFEK